MIYIVTGRREQGKTTLGTWMTRQLPKRVIFDPRGMIRQPGAIRVTDSETMFGWIEALPDDPEVSEIAYSPADDDLQRAFDGWTRAIKALIVRFPAMVLGVLIDEVSFVDLKAPTFQWIAKCSLRDAVQIVLTAHRPIDVPTNIRSIADHWMIFPTRQEHDLKVIGERTSPYVAEEARKLAPRQFVHWDDGRGRSTLHLNPQHWYLALRPSVPAAPRLTPIGESEPTAGPLFEV